MPKKKAKNPFAKSKQRDPITGELVVPGTKTRPKRKAKPKRKVSPRKRSGNLPTLNLDIKERKGRKKGRFTKQ